MIVEINSKKELKKGDLLIAKEDDNGKISFDYINKDELLADVNERIKELEKQQIIHDNVEAEREKKLESISNNVDNKLKKIIKIIGEEQ